MADARGRVLGKSAVKVGERLMEEAFARILCFVGFARAALQQTGKQALIGTVLLITRVT
jgi:hypothetical protein